MADTQPAKLQPAEPQPASQQVTSKIPTTAPAKNPKWVAAGKAVAEKTRQAREAQKKAAAEATVIIENNKADRQAQNKAKESPDTSTDSSSILTTTQWLSVVSILVSVLGIYYKREEIKKVFSKPSKSQKQPDVDVPPKAPKVRGGIRSMD